MGQGRIAIDHAIIPVRRLREAVASRVILEIQQHAASHTETFVQFGGVWDHFALTPGGVVYSLEPLDQERILASGFARLIEVLVRYDVPISFLDFPRFTTDRRYLHEKLRPVLPADLTLDTFTRRMEAVIDPSMVRVEKELRDIPERHGGGAEYLLSLRELDTVAQRRLLMVATSNAMRWPPSEIGLLRRWRISLARRTGGPWNLSGP